MARENVYLLTPEGLREGLLQQNPGEGVPGEAPGQELQGKMEGTLGLLSLPTPPLTPISCQGFPMDKPS